jgi:hypothetical protein
LVEHNSGLFRAASSGKHQGNRLARAEAASGPSLPQGGDVDSNQVQALQGSRRGLRRQERSRLRSSGKGLSAESDAGVLSKTRANGDIVLFDPATNAFGVMDETEAPRTFYIPDAPDMGTRPTWTTSMHNDSCLHCRVCGYGSKEPPWGVDGRTPVYDFCVCCGVEHGYQDASPMGARSYRAAWIAAGAKWEEANERPHGWNLAEQLRHVPPEFQ